MPNETNLGNNLIQLYAELNCNLKETKNLIDRIVYHSKIDSSISKYLLVCKLIKNYTELLQSFYSDDYTEYEN